MVSGSGKKKNRTSYSNYLGRFEEGELEGGFRISQWPKGEEVSGKTPVQHGGEHQRTGKRRGRLSFELSHENAPMNERTWKS